MTWRKRLGQRAKRDEVGTTATLPFLMHSAQTLVALGFGRRPDCIHTTNGSGKSSLVAPRRSLPAEAVVLRSTVHSSPDTLAQWHLCLEFVWAFLRRANFVNFALPITESEL